ncbi:MAG TPA: helix-turn-helix transcriptional regulator [Caulobacteraceae bacterium]|nr:helix-turn-helix transcriptional regulator [Caulobacteraceae bacterium]
MDGGRAHEAGLSRFHLLRLFRAAYGASPIAYAEAVRMQRVRCLLTDGAGQVGEVAAALGYDSPSAFARPFRRRTGRAPGDVRRI